MELKGQKIELVGWIGLDELGSGRYGLKIGKVPAGLIPIIAMDYHLDRALAVRPQMEAQAQQWGKRIRLCRFTLSEVICETESGED